MIVVNDTYSLLSCYFKVYLFTILFIVYKFCKVCGDMHCSQLHVNLVDIYIYIYNKHLL